MGSNPLPTAPISVGKFKPKNIYLITYDDEGKKGLSIRVVRYDGPNSWEDLGVTGNLWRQFKEENILVAQEINPGDKSTYIFRFYVNSQPRYYKEASRVTPSLSSKPFDPANLPEPIDFGINFDPENP